MRVTVAKPYKCKLLGLYNRFWQKILKQMQTLQYLYSNLWILFKIKELDEYWRGKLTTFDVHQKINNCQNRNQSEKFAIEHRYD